MKEKIIFVNEDNTLLNVLQINFKDLSKKKIKSFIKYKMIQINDQIITNSNVLVKKGSIIKVLFGKTKILEYNMDIIYEDKDLICINKPAGLLSISNNKERVTTAYRMVSDYIKKNNKKARIFVVHRIDQATSGVLLFAKNEKIKKELQDNWNKIVTKREYIAVVEGKIKKEDTIESYLKMNHFQIVYSAKDNDGWYAKTHYQVIKYKNNFSILKVDISTGRRNQIRVHLSEKGFPIVGDKKYGSKIDPFNRLMLHASELSLIDPRTKKEISFKAPCKFLDLPQLEKTVKK